MLIYILDLHPFFILMIHVLSTVNRSGAEHKPQEEKSMGDFPVFYVFSIYALPKFILVLLSSQDMLQNPYTLKMNKKNAVKYSRIKKSGSLALIPLFLHTLAVTITSLHLFMATEKCF